MTAADTPNAEQELRTIVLRRAKRVSRIPLLSESVGQILQISRQSTDDVNIAEFDRLISRSPTLTSRLLSVANSTYYSLASKVTTVRQAIITLGIRDAVSLMLVTSLMGQFDSSSEMSNLDPAEFRTHAIGTGAAARAGAALCSIPFLSPTEVGLAGLVHDIGRTIFIRFFPSEFDPCLAQAREKDCLLRDSEIETFGIGHDELGGILAQEWGLPAFICQTIQHHHNVGMADESYRDAIALIAWSNCLLRTEGIGQALEPPHLLRAALSAAAEEDERIARLLRNLDSRQKDILEAVQKDLKLTQDSPPETTFETLSPVSAPSERPPEPFPAPRKRGFLERLLDWFRG